MIFKGSRYEKLAAAARQIVTPDGQAHSALPLRFIPPTPAQYRHRIGAADRLDLLAYHFFKNAEKFWLIADANPDPDPEQLLEVGRQILIPPDRSV